MPRKTKELNDEKETKNIDSNTVKNKLENKNKKVTSKETKKSSKVESSSKLKKTNANDLSTNIVSKKSTVRKTSKRTSTKKTSVSNSTTSKKASSSKANSLKNKTKKETYINNEYYDLPYRYNQTVVKVLAQTPNNLFIYWDISDDDRENLKKQYGENFFETTYPVLIVYNDTLNYHFEVSINDFANSWYLHVNDSKSDYRIELGRRPIDYLKFNEDVRTVNKDISNNIDYIHISTSNEIESPNDRILFNKEQKMVYYKNVKTNVVKSKPITSLTFMNNIGKIYNIYELYKHFYNEENIEDIYNLSNPSSGNPSSNFPSSSYFKH